MDSVLNWIDLEEYLAALRGMADGIIQDIADGLKDAVRVDGQGGQAGCYFNIQGDVFIFKFVLRGAVCFRNQFADLDVASAREGVRPHLLGRGS